MGGKVDYLLKVCLGYNIVIYEKKKKERRVLEETVDDGLSPQKKMGKKKKKQNSKKKLLTSLSLSQPHTSSTYTTSLDSESVVLTSTRRGCPRSVIAVVVAIDVVVAVTDTS